MTVLPVLSNSHLGTWEFAAKCIQQWQTRSIQQACVSWHTCRELAYAPLKPRVLKMRQQSGS
jgi:hypothetical protein